MKRTLPLTIIMFWFACPCFGEVLTSQNGDQHVGRVINAHFTIKAPYGSLRLPVNSVHTLSALEDQPDAFTIKTINNDLFSGQLSPQHIKFKPEYKPPISFFPSQIQTIQRNRHGRTHPIQTAIFSMKNGDQFSGSLVTDPIVIQTESVDQHITADNLLRMAFPNKSDDPTRIFLKNGGLLKGRLLTEHLVISPNTIPSLTVCVQHFRTIQFNARKLVRYQELPPVEPIRDADADGVPDDLDQCPDTSCEVAANDLGCPQDQDRDGVIDSEDACPNTPKTAPVDPDGCWRPGPILFDFNQDKIKPRHRRVLSIVARVMEKNPGLQMEIRGHTDSVGAEAYNQGLSMRRANAAAAALQAEGVEKGRIAVKGFGFARPAASNETEEGRSLNRRAELWVKSANSQ